MKITEIETRKLIAMEEMIADKSATSEVINKVMEIYTVL